MSRSRNLNNPVDPTGAVLSPQARRRRQLALEFIAAALAAVDARACTERAILGLRARGVALDGCTLFAFGKAARGMAEGALSACSVRQGIVLGYEAGRLGPLELLRAGHPLPAPDAAEHGTRVRQLARKLTMHDVALCLISGGGSAMLELPQKGVQLNSISATTHALLLAGANVGELNAVRASLSQLKDGGLARAIAPAAIVNIAISDVINDDLSVIACGPTVPPGQRAEPRAIIERYGLREHLPLDARFAIDAFEPAPLADTARITSVIAANNTTARHALRIHARSRGFVIANAGASVTGVARQAGPAFYREALERMRVEPLDGVVGGGETTVEVRGPGRGGRNQEFALGALGAYGHGLLLALDTDGIDGTSGAAGALIDEAVKAHAQHAGLVAQSFLDANDSHHFFAQVGTEIVTGPTGTNVADVYLVLG